MRSITGYPPDISGGKRDPVAFTVTNHHTNCSSFLSLSLSLPLPLPLPIAHCSLLSGLSLVLLTSTLFLCSFSTSTYSVHLHQIKQAVNHHLWTPKKPPNLAHNKRAHTLESHRWIVIGLPFSDSFQLLLPLSADTAWNGVPQPLSPQGALNFAD
jgi:hypothetical protein